MTPFGISRTAIQYTITIALIFVRVRTRLLGLGSIADWVLVNSDDDTFRRTLVVCGVHCVAATL